MANILLVDKTDITVYKNSGILIDYKNGLDVIKVLKGAVKVKGRSKANIFAQGDAVKMLNGRFKD